MIVGMAAAILPLGSCGTQDGDIGVDTVSVALDTASRSGSFTKSNGKTCRQRVAVSVACPKQYKDKQATERIRRLVAQYVLEAPDSIDLHDAVARYATSLLIQDTPRDEQEADLSEAEADGTLMTVSAIEKDPLEVDDIDIAVNVTVVYNDRDIVTFCKEETVTKNKTVSSTVHHYFSFDLQAMALVQLNRLFRDINLYDITALLREQLLKQNNVDSDDRLNELGYFNLPNLQVTDNFFFTDDAVVWSFEPNTLAIGSVGEPQIAIPISDLEPFLLDNSLLNRF